MNQKKRQNYLDLWTVDLLLDQKVAEIGFPALTAHNLENIREVDTQLLCLSGIMCIYLSSKWCLHFLLRITRITRKPTEIIWVKKLLKTHQVNADTVINRIPQCPEGRYRTLGMWIICGLPSWKRGYNHGQRISLFTWCGYYVFMALSFASSEEKAHRAMYTAVCRGEVTLGRWIICGLASWNHGYKQGHGISLFTWRGYVCMLSSIFRKFWEKAHRAKYTGVSRGEVSHTHTWNVDYMWSTQLKQWFHKATG